jgi:hypothetical protein
MGHVASAARFAQLNDYAGKFGLEQLDQESGGEEMRKRCKSGIQTLVGTRFIASADLSLPTYERFISPETSFDESRTR